MKKNHHLTFNNKNKSKTDSIDCQIFNNSQCITIQQENDHTSKSLQRNLLSIIRNQGFNILLAMKPPR